MNIRKARRKLGSRTTRRNGTNGKCTGKTGTGGRAIKRRYPKPRSRRNAISVRRIMAGLEVSGIAKKRA